MTGSCYHASFFDPFVLCVGLCGRMCVFLFAVFQLVRLVSKEGSKNPTCAINPMKMALKRVFQGRKLVAGAGFEPATFRL